MQVERIVGYWCFFMQGSITLAKIQILSSEKDGKYSVSLRML